LSAQDAAVCARAEVLAGAQSMGADAYQANLVKRCLYLSAAENTYSQKGQAMRRQAIKELEEQHHKASGFSP
jgi:hypothetical protein